MKKIVVVKKAEVKAKPSNFCPFMIEYFDPQR
jgi:hypothetical protein